ncbi:hypothetical protein D3C84_123650 [compost metagenome]
MSDTNPLDQQDDLELPSELDMLKQRATMMGIVFSNNIGLDTLKKKIDEKMNETPETAEAPAALVAPAVTEAPVAEAAQAPVKVLSLRQHLLNEATKLVRIRISCMDPKKQDLPGEFFTVANEFIGTVRKYVPFGEATDGGYHVPACILEMLKTREFLHIRTVTHPVTKEISTKTRYVKEFAIEILPPLTPAELKALAADQSASGRLEDRD